LFDQPLSPKNDSVNTNDAELLGPITARVTTVATKKAKWMNPPNISTAIRSLLAYTFKMTLKARYAHTNNVMCHSLGTYVGLFNSISPCVIAPQT
jgi:hypothetical protein